MTAGDIVILLAIISYIIYRTLTPKKGDTTSTPVGRFFGALFKSILAVIVISLVFALFYMNVIGSSIGSFFGVLALFGQ